MRTLSRGLCWLVAFVGAVMILAGVALLTGADAVDDRLAQEDQ